MKIARSLLDQIVEHARQDAPDECCGLVGSVDGRATSVHATTNTVRSPLRFEIDGMELFRTMESIEDGGADLHDRVFVGQEQRSVPEHVAAR